MDFKEIWHCRYPTLKQDVKFIFSKVGPVQFVRAMLMDRGKWKPIFFSAQYPVLLYEKGEISSASDPQFHELRQTAMTIIESRIKDYQKLRGVVGVDERAQFRDLEELAHAFVPWQIDKVVRTGDVERGAEQALMTAQGAEVMKNHRVTPRLRRKLDAATQYRRKLVRSKFPKWL